MQETSIKVILDFILEYSGIIAIIFTAIATFFVQRNLKRAEYKDNLKEVYGKQKQLALVELMNILDKNNDKLRIVLHHREDCKAICLNNNENYIMLTLPDLDNLDATEELVIALNSFCTKNFVYLEESLIIKVGYLISYLNHYLYYCKRQIIIPNLLTTLFLRDEFTQLQRMIINQIKKSYTKPIISKKISYFDSKKNEKRFLKVASKYNLHRIANYQSLDESFINFNYSLDMKVELVKKYKRDAELYIHALYCKNCTLDCELAGLYFRNIPETSVKQEEPNNA